MPKLGAIVLTTVLCYCFATANIFAEVQLKPVILEQANKASVSIEVTSEYGAAAIGSWAGSGFIVDKKNGFIVTNAHVAGYANIARYTITLHNGRKILAKLAYCDPIRDFAILKLKDGYELLEAEIKFSSVAPTTNGDSVFIVSNAEGIGFSFHSGYLSNLLTNMHLLSQHTYVVNVNSAAGASGAALLNKSGECIGIIYGGGRTYALALNAEYIKTALTNIVSGQNPKRNCLGAMYQMYSIDNAIKHRDFDPRIAELYLKKFPESRGEVIMISSILSGYESGLRPGDIVWEVGGVQVGPSIYTIDNIIDGSKDDKMKFTVYRDGAKRDEIVKLQNAMTNSISTIVEFAGATFVEADEMISRMSGIPIGSLLITKIKHGSSFAELAALHLDGEFHGIVVDNIDGQKVHSIKRLLDLLPSISKNTYITIDFRNYAPYRHRYNDTLINAHCDLTADIVLNPAVDNHYKIFQYDTTAMEWTSSVNNQQSDPIAPESNAAPSAPTTKDTKVE